MEKSLILITRSVMNSNPESINTYNELISFIDTPSDVMIPEVGINILREGLK